MGAKSGRCDDGDLGRMLSALRDNAGAPSLREIASRTGGQISHTTVADVFNGKRVASWRVIAAIVRGLGGEEDDFWPAWSAATIRDAEKRAEKVTEKSAIMQQSLETLFEHAKGVVKGRPFHVNEFGDIDVYLIDDPILPADALYFMVRTTVSYSGGLGYRWQAYHGPVECFEGLASGGKQEAFEQALAHYSAPQG